MNFLFTNTIKIILLIAFRVRERESMFLYDLFGGFIRRLFSFYILIIKVTKKVSSREIVVLATYKIMQKTIIPYLATKKK